MARYIIRKCIAPDIRVGLKAGFPIYSNPETPSTPIRGITPHIETFIRDFQIDQFWANPPAPFQTTLSPTSLSKAHRPWGFHHASLLRPTKSRLTLKQILLFVSKEDLNGPEAIFGPKDWVFRLDKSGNIVTRSNFN